MNGCLACRLTRPASDGSTSAVFSVEDDHGAEHLSCEEHVGALLTRLFDEGLVIAPAWGVKVYGLR